MAQHEKVSQKPFRVIIVGAGLVGLSLSHALQLANIEHVVLEKHSKIVSVHGAALMIYPGVARIFDQFGILKKIQDATTPIDREFQRWPDGSIQMHGNFLNLLSENFDMPIILFDRQKCVTHLYDNLPDQSRIRTSARVDRIEHTESGIKVFLTDGTFEEGDLVIGADGVHSLVRQLMWDYAAENEPDAIPQSDRQALFTQYKGIFGVSDQKDLPDLGHADVNIVLGHDCTKLVFTQPGVAYWALVYKDEHSQPPKPYKPNEEEREEVARRFKDVKLGETLTFEGLWKNKTRAGVLNMEEGILDKWHAGRMVLVGDSAHKMTADLGMGANMGIESAVALCNVLHRTLASSPHPTASDLTAIFTEYQSKRYDRAKTFMTLSGKVTRMRSYQSLWQRFFVTRIATLPFFQNMQTKDFVAGFAKCPKLEYVKTRTINENAEGWKVPENKGEGKQAPWVLYALVTSAVGVGLSYAAVLKWGSPL